MTAPTTPSMRFGRLLLTGAAGGLGRELRQRLKPHCDTLRLSDLANLGAAAANELGAFETRERVKWAKVVKDGAIKVN